ncbi:MAG: DUF742 domain-containing protein [Acidimicrobiales bacterium]
MTQGRVRSIGQDLPLDTLVQATKAGTGRADRMPAEQAAIISLSQRPLSIAEIAARLHVYLGVARVIVSDMVASSYVAISTSDYADDGPDLPALERLLDDLQAL